MGGASAIQLIKILLIQLRKTTAMSCFSHVCLYDRNKNSIQRWLLKSRFH